jgi:hypothetical protein
MDNNTKERRNNGNQGHKLKVVGLGMTFKKDFML